MAKPNQQLLLEFFTEHLPYEINMLRATYALLQTGGLLGPIVANTLIESFCVHTRNLIEFFKTKDSCDFDPRDFASPGYELNKRFIGDSILPKITNQISHLTVNRQVDPAAKIGPEDRFQIMKSLEGEIARFKSHLRDEWAAKCAFDAGVMVRIGDTADQSSHPTFVNTT